MKKIKKERHLYVIKSDQGYLSHSIFYPIWKDKITYDTKMFVRLSYALQVVEKKTRSNHLAHKNIPAKWENVTNAEVAVVKVECIGTCSELAEKEFLK